MSKNYCVVYDTSQGEDFEEYFPNREQAKSFYDGLKLNVTYKQLQGYDHETRNWNDLETEVIKRD